MIIPDNLCYNGSHTGTFLLDEPLYLLGRIDMQIVESETFIMPFCKAIERYEYDEARKNVELI